jgi:DNA modification methylase
MKRMETDTIYCGDCTEVMRRHVPDNSIDLIYADPPFFSNKPYEVIWGDGYERRAFDDRWKGGIENYVAWMEPKLRECHRVLKDTGSMYLHCDWHAGHRLQVLMDKIFHENLVNEIIWKRTSAHTGEGKVRSFGTVHDVILFYSKSDNYTFIPQYVPLNKDYVEKFYRNVDKQGRRYTSSDLTARGIRHGESGKPWHGIDPSKNGNHWKTTISKLDELEKQGRIIFPKKVAGMPRYKRYLDEMKGQLLQDIWTDISPVQAHAKERLGYPTQKPEQLLERIITGSSNAMDIILDPFCGCGTSIVVAHKLGRRWIGIDISPTSCKLIEKRLRKLHAKYAIIGLPQTVEELRAIQPFEFQNWVFEKLHGRVNPRKVGDFGIDGWIELDVPTQVKQSDDIGRNVVDNFETAIRRMGKKKGVIVAFSFGSGANEEVARAHNEEGLEIKLKTVAEILKES